jgi:hypothetical protein
LKKRRTPWKFVVFTDANIRGPNRLPVNGPGGAAVGIGGGPFELQLIVGLPSWG